MFERIQHLFERLVGEPASVRMPLHAFRPRYPLRVQSERPACWRREKRVTVRR